MARSKSLVQIVGDLGDLDTFVADDEFLILVNQEPPASFVQDHPLAPGVKYIPIDKIEMMLTRVFQQWRVEIRNSGQLLNAVFMNIRLHYKHPITGDWTFQDGTGAVAIQVDKGKNASDLGAIKSNAIMLALPSAKSYAIKDAAENIGKVFGRDLNRKDTLAFNPSYATDEGRNKVEVENIEKIAAAITIEGLDMVVEAMKPNDRIKFVNEIAMKRRDILQHENIHSNNS